MVAPQLAVNLKEVVLEPKLALDGLDLWQFPTVGPNGVPTNSRNLSQQRFTLRHTPTGDANNDGTVGFDDFLILSNGFGAEGVWDDGDFDFDGVVGFSDFLGLSANFRASSNAAIPEPSTGLLAAFGALGLLGLRCRRRGL